MTILQAQQLQFIGSALDSDMDKSVKMVGVITGLTPEQIDGKPIYSKDGKEIIGYKGGIGMRKFNRICAKIKSHFDFLTANLLRTEPVKFVRAKGRTYRLHYRVDKLPITAAKYVEVATYGQDVIPNLHKIMASISEPVKWSWRKWSFIPYKRGHADIATDMEHVNFRAAYHAAVFFYTHYQVSMILIRPYLIKQLTRKGVPKEEAIKTLSSLSVILDGFTMPKWSQNLREYLLNRFGTSELYSS